MYLSRSKNNAVARSYKYVNSLHGYLRLIVDIYQSSEIKFDFWLTKSEKEFYVATILAVLSGSSNPISDSSVQIYKKYFRRTINKSVISDYLNKCRKKGWLKYDTEERSVEIPAIFHGINIKDDTFDFNLRYVYELKDETD